jgi:hypothetical protein
VADNDLAVGRTVDAITHSKYWKDSAIFVVEDDSQDGADHVDGHRAPIQIISPWAQHGTVDSRSHVECGRGAEVLATAVGRDRHGHWFSKNGFPNPFVTRVV